MRTIIALMGNLLSLLAVMLIPSLIMSFLTDDGAQRPFLLSLGVVLLFALPSMLLKRKQQGGIQLTRKEGYILLTLSWLFLSLFSALPYLLGGYTPSVADAFFEAVSGITSTGATILMDIEALPDSMLLFRSLTQWVGGLGIILLTIAILPFFGVSNLQMFASEASSLTRTRILPRFGETARRILSVYLGLTLLLGLLLHWGGMNVLDSVCHALTTTSTGGFSTHQESIAYFHSPFIEYTTTLFMFMSGINFFLLVMVMEGKFKHMFRDEEFRLYTVILGVFTLFIAFMLFITSSMDVEESFRKAIFQVVSLCTSTGLSSDNMVWVPAVSCVLSLLMIMGGCAGSTSGGIKQIRILVMAKNAKNEFKHILHPSAFLPVRLNRQAVPDSLTRSILAFCFFYALILCGATITLSALGSSLSQALSCSISALGNMGPVMGSLQSEAVWSALPDLSKYLMMLLMLLGRLELFAFLMLLHPTFWKKN